MQAGSKLFPLSDQDAAIARASEHGEQTATDAAGRCAYWKTADEKPMSYDLADWTAVKLAEACSGTQLAGRTAPAPQSAPASRLVVGSASSPASRLYVQSDTPRAELAERGAEQQRHADLLSDSEIRSGRCEPSRLSALQAHLHRNNEIRKFLNETDWLMLVAQKIAVVKVEGVTFSFDSLIGGEIHVFAVGYNDPDLLVLNSQGDPSMLTSGYEMRWPAAETRADVLYGTRVILSDEEMQFKVSGRIRSRMIQMNNGESLSVRVKGKPCQRCV
jgi:hypothetical protein